MSIQARATQYGKLFGNWKIRDFIGEGSQGKTGVFRIIKSYEDFQDENALKVVTVLREDGWPEELTEDARREYQSNKAALCAQAVNEVKLMNRLAGDPYVVPYQNWEFCDWEESGQFGCDLLIQMPMLVTLRRLQKTEEYFSEEEIYRVGRDICRALIRCGEEGILHRDIKPANIFLAPNRKGNYMLGDFGISRIVEGGLGGASTLVGTLDYAAPEQFISGYDSRVDTYSLGLTLYELANQNHLPFWKPGSGSAEVVKQRLSGSILPSPCQANPALAQIILRACAFRPEDRYQTAAEFLAALDGAHPQPSPVINLWTIPLEELSRRARQGDASAQDAMGMRYYTGKGIQRNYETAVSWFRMAAEQGVAHAMTHLSICYYAGLGVEYNPREAFDWALRAAEHGTPASMRDLGRFYLAGETVPRDLSAAAHWFRKGAEFGSPEAMVDLAQCYWDGLGVEKGLKQAESWFQKAAELGYTFAIERLNILRSAVEPLTIH